MKEDDDKEIKQYDDDLLVGIKQYDRYFSNFLLPSTINVVRAITYIILPLLPISQSLCQ